MHKTSPEPEANPPAALLATYRPFPFPIVAGNGECLFDESGQRYLDFYGGHCVAVTGHCHPTVTAAIEAQAHQLIFYSAAARLPVRDQAAQALVDFAGDGMDSVFFCNSGAEANENALKVALKLTGRRKLAAFSGGFHGRTLLALSATDSSALRSGCESLLAPCTFLPFGDPKALDVADFSQIAAVIVEPIQSMAGVRTADPAWFAALRNKCDRAGTLMILDEIQTGMGRLGSPFAADHYSIAPDMITCAKGMASGVPMGALLISRAIAADLRPGDLGSTFGGGPLACAALLATLAVLEDEALMERATAIADGVRAGLQGGPVSEVRGEGALLGLVVGRQAAALKAWLLSQRIVVGASNDPGVLRLMPPLTIAAQSIGTLVEAIGAFGLSGGEGE